MKKAIIVLLSMFMCFGGAAFAHELGNPAMLISQGEFGLGFQWNSVFKQGFEDFDMKRSYSDGYRDTGRKNADFEDDQYYMGTVTYGILDQLNVFARLGMVDGGKWLSYQAGNNWKANLDSNFVWAIGAKGNIYQFGNGLGFGLGAQYMRYDDRKVKNWRSTDAGLTASDLGWATNDKINDWQLDVMANAYWTIGAFTPYVGAGYTHCNVDYSARWTGMAPYNDWIDYDASFSNQNKFTALAGIDVNLGMNFTANIQGTFVSSTALTLGISYRF